MEKSTNQTESETLTGGEQQLQPLYHEPQDDETVDEYKVVMRVRKNQSERSVTVEETFDVVAVSESMAGEEAKHLAKEKYGSFDRVLEVMKW